MIRATINTPNFVMGASVHISPIEKGVPISLGRAVTISHPGTDGVTQVLVRNGTNGHPKWSPVTSIIRNDMDVHSSLWVFVRPIVEAGLGFQSLLIQENIELKDVGRVSLLSLDHVGICGAQSDVGVQNVGVEAAIELCGPKGAKYRASRVLVDGELVPLGDSKGRPISDGATITVVTHTH